MRGRSRLGTAIRLTGWRRSCSAVAPTHEVLPHREVVHGWGSAGAGPRRPGAPAIGAAHELWLATAAAPVPAGLARRPAALAPGCWPLLGAELPS